MMSANNKSTNQDLRISVQKRLAKIDKNKIRNWFTSASSEKTPEWRGREILGEIIKCIGISTWPVAHHILYRCRPWKDDKHLPTELSELMAPPKEYVSRNRCNLDNVPTLYVAEDPRILVSECHIKQGEKYIVLQFDRITEPEDINCLALGMEYTHAFSNDQRSIMMDGKKREFFGKQYKKIKFIESMLHREFVRDDDPTGLTYRITSNLVDLIFGLDMNIDAVYYPSVASNGYVNNLALKPDSIHKAYKPVKAGLYQLSSDGTSPRLNGAVIENKEIKWGETVKVDNPIPVSVSSVNPDDSNIYIAPWRQRN